MERVGLFAFLPRLFALKFISFDRFKSLLRLNYNSQFSAIFFLFAEIRTGTQSTKTVFCWVWSKIARMCHTVALQSNGHMAVWFCRLTAGYTVWVAIQARMLMFIQRRNIGRRFTNNNNNNNHRTRTGWTNNAIDS